MLRNEKQTSGKRFKKNERIEKGKEKRKERKGKERKEKKGAQAGVGER